MPRTLLPELEAVIPEEIPAHVPQDQPDANAAVAPRDQRPPRPLPPFL